MANLSFDRAAGYYDATRGYAPGSAERIRDAILAHVGAGRRTRFLELGVGTGRIALPFIRAGFGYTGVDISRAMMARLAARIASDPDLAGARYALHQADVCALPFLARSFDVVVAVHVLHLVHDWQAVLREARRVLRPAGWLLLGNDDDCGGQTIPLPPARVRDRWIELRRELGIARSDDTIVWGEDDRLLRHLRALGAAADVVDLAAFDRPAISAREMLERYRARMYSSDWETSDELHDEAVRRLEAWMHQEIAEPDRPFSSQGRFTAIAARWPEVDVDAPA